LHIILSPFAPSFCKLDLKLSTDKLGVSLGAERLGTLDRSTESTVNDDLRKDTKGTGNTEEDGVVVGFGKTVVLEEHTRVLQRVSIELSNQQDKTYSVNIGVGVLGLSVLGQDTRSNLVDLADELEHGVVREVAESKLALRHVTRVGLTKHSVSVTRDDLASVQGGPEVVLDSLVAEVVANGLLHLLKPDKDFLVGPVRCQ
jgi:hypothetical protein